jgi:hypothetical protein
MVGKLTGVIRTPKPVFAMLEIRAVCRAFPRPPFHPSGTSGAETM